MASKIYEHYLVSTPSPFVAHVEINRPQKLNAFFDTMWLELKTIMDALSIDPEVRAVIISGAGDKAFSAGLDVEAANIQNLSESDDVARRAVSIKRYVQQFQDCISSVEKCEKRTSAAFPSPAHLYPSPAFCAAGKTIILTAKIAVICVLHGYSLGLAIDLSTCADIRIASANTKFAVKEVDIGLAADIGTLTRLPKVVGSFSWVKDVCLTARIFGAEEALRVGFVSHVVETKQAALEAALKMAQLIATKSPVAVQGTKELLNHARDHTVADSLRYTGVWNSAAIQTSDVERAMLSGLQKTKPRFEKL
jgi:delta(3,5)-delta(2,4)-dienoyl-CoA isomerase